MLPAVPAQGTDALLALRNGATDVLVQASTLPNGVPIPNLPAAAALNGSEQVALSQTQGASQVNVQATLQTILGLLATLGVKNLTVGPPTSGIALTVNGAPVGIGDFSLNNTGNANGVNFRMLGPGSTTPSKYLRVYNGTFALINDSYTASLLSVTDAGAATVLGPMGINNNAPPAQLTGWGTPTGGAVANNFNGASATLPQTSAALAQVIASLKAFGLFGA